MRMISVSSNNSNGRIKTGGSGKETNMPHVKIKCFSGRTEEQKRRCAQKIAEDISEILECDMSSVSVAIVDVDREDWKEEVWDKDMVADKDHLYKEPGYTYD